MNPTPNSLEPALVLPPPLCAIHLTDGKLKGKGGATYALHAGLCLETQGFPNAINQPKFPSGPLHGCLNCLACLHASQVGSAEGPTWLHLFICAQIQPLHCPFSPPCHCAVVLRPGKKYRHVVIYQFFSKATATQ